MKIKITCEQLEAISETVGDVKFIEIEEGNGGNVHVYLDGIEKEEVIVAENGDIL